MKQAFNVFFIILLLLNLIKNINASEKRLLIANTDQENEYVYHPFIPLAESVGLSVSYKPLSDLLDSDKKNLSPQEYDAAFFIIDYPFLKNYYSSPAAQKIKTLIKQFLHTHSKLIGFFFSPTINLQSKAFEKIKSYLDDLLLEVNPKSSFPHFLDLFFHYPFEKRSTLYHTSLLEPTHKQSFPLLNQQSRSQKTLALLPLQKPLDPHISPLWPFSLYAYNPSHENHILFGSSSLLKAFGIEENFKLCPIDFSLRRIINNEIHQFMFEIKTILDTPEKQSIDTLTKTNKKKGPLPQSIFSVGSKKITHSEKNECLKKIPWMELAAFEDKKKEKDQKQLIDYIYMSNLENLWISLAPNMYYSPLGKKNTNKEKKALFQRIKKFTALLKKEGLSRKKTAPKILIGFELSNNFEHHENLKKTPEIQAFDLYGFPYDQGYGSVSACDDFFWNNEFFKPLHNFVSDWPEISNGIEIGGIVLDLELYFCTPASFPATSGFHPHLRNAFSPDFENKTHEDFLNYLIEKKETEKYFSFLKTKAQVLGKKIQKTCNKLIPQGTIGFYTPKIQTSWFYSGLMSGLSSQKKALHLMTFNNEYSSHKPWLEKNGIFSTHAGVIMLSKLKKSKNKKLFDYVLFHNDGIWINRFSRLVERYKKNEWYTLEQTSLSTKDKNEVISYLGLK